MFLGASHGCEIRNALIGWLRGDGLMKNTGKQAEENIMNLEERVQNVLKFGGKKSLICVIKLWVGACGDGFPNLK
jgi:hypothetical protein